MAWTRAACYRQILGFALVNSLCNGQLEGSAKNTSVVAPYLKKRLKIEKYQLWSSTSKYK